MRSDMPRRGRTWSSWAVALRLGVILTFAGIAVVCIQSVAVAEQLPMTHNCMVYEPNYCKFAEYYDQWESSGGNVFTFHVPVMYDDPCDDQDYNGLGRECDWTGEVFQNHEWTLGVVELTGTHAVNTLMLSAVTGQNNGEDKIDSTVTAIACPKPQENCYTQYSWLQSSVLEDYKNDHLAIAEGYNAPCTLAGLKDEFPCPGRKIWGFEGQGDY